jgi:hypothetical protein
MPTVPTRGGVSGSVGDLCAEKWVAVVTIL